MQEEEDPLLHDLPWQTLITWTRWWHLTSKALVLVLKKRIWGVVGNFLKDEKHRVDNRIASLRINWARRGRELRALDVIKRSAYLDAHSWLLLHHRMSEQSSEHLPRTEGEGTRVLLLCRARCCYQFLDWLTTWIQTLFLLTRKVEKEAKRQKSEPTTPISIFAADLPTNTMRRGLGQNSTMLKKNHRKSPVRDPI